MKVLIVGGGGREHALAWKVGRSELVNEVLCAPGNGGTCLEAENVPVAADDLDNLVRLVEERDVDLTVIGPEQPIVLGLADRLEAIGRRVFGPSAAAARLEGSKVFARRFMKRHGIPSVEFEASDDVAHLEDIVRGWPEDAMVVKADGLAAGKGVLVCGDRTEALEAVRAMAVERRFGAAGSRVIIEQRLSGPEVSMLAVADGERCIPLAPARDFKKAFDGDRGQNTGGMGAYSPVPGLDDRLIATIHATILEPVVAAMKQEGIPFRGLLYAGLMLTRSGPRVLEFNVRFGDPETQPLLMRMASDLVPPMMQAAVGRLETYPLRWLEKCAHCVVCASGGYPGEYEKGMRITGLDAAVGEDVMVFHAGTTRRGDELVTSGGRVLAVTALGDDHADASRRVYEVVTSIHFTGMRFRSDISPCGLDHQDGVGR
ncbi:phosphoribosylamine--glycine ligase [bacterium]|nr:phosphoribosylamine--glycine ligase [candidate division CSSED10-310 bacterium]